MAKLLLGSVVGPQGPQGTPGVNGSQGPQGIPGPSEIAATTDVVGLTTGQLLYNNGGKVGSVEIVDNLLSVNPNKPLSANQGKVLKGLIDGNSSAIGQLQNERLTQNLEVYISPSGSDTTGDGTQLNPYKTIQKGVDSIPFNSNKKVAFLKIAGGTYTEDVLINTIFSGAMVLDLLGNVIINGSVQIYTIPYISIQNNNLTLNSVGKNALYANNNCFLNIAVPLTINGCMDGIFVENGAKVKTNTTATTVKINNAMVNAIHVRNSSSITFQGNVGGTGNTNGFVADGATIFINTENISSTTKITKTFGGQIWTGAGVNLT